MRKRLLIMAMLLTAAFVGARAQSTDCTDYATIPYSHDFEGISTGGQPPCWTAVTTGANGSNTFPSVYVYAPNTRNGSGYYEFEASSSSSSVEIAALPLMQNLTDLKLTMWVSSSSSYPCRLEVGVWEEDNSTFVPVDTLDLYTFSGASDWKTSYREYTVYFNEYTGSGERIAIRATRTGSGQYTLFIDDLTVTDATLPEVSLPTTAATNINTDLSITASFGGNTDGLYFTWLSTMNDAGNATMSNIDNVLTINYSVAGTDTVTVIATNNYGSDTATMIVRALDLSPVTEFPYITGFEADQDANWQFVNGNNAWYIGTAAGNPNNGLFISNDNAASNVYNVSGICMSYAYRPMQFTETGEYGYSFDWRAYGEGSYDYLRAWLAPASFEFTANQLPDGSTSAYSYQNTTPSGWIDLGNGKLNQQSSWQTKSGTFMLTNAGSYNLVFMWANDVSGGTQPPAAVDNIEIAPLTCSAVANITLDDAQPDALTFHWTSLGTESEWQVTVGNNPPESVYDTFYTASNLDTNTAYNIVVRAVCGSDDMSLPTTASFRTSCGFLTPPFIETFEDAGALSCWTMQNTSSSTGHYTSSARTGQGCFRFYYTTNPPQYLITPQLYGTENDGVTLSFWYKKYNSSYNENFRVGYSTSGPADENFTWSDEITDASTSEYKEFSAVYPVGVKYIAIKYTANNHYYLYIDDFHVGIDNGCTRPNAAYVDSVGPYEAYLRWTAGGNSVDSYDLYYSRYNSIDSATVINGITDTAYTLTSLLPQTTYYAWVRSSCSGDESDFRNFPAFTTDMTCAPLTGVTMGDISYTAAVISWNYNTSEGFPSSDVVITITDNSDNTVPPVVVNTNGTSYTVTGLEAGHSYTAVLRNICDVTSQYDTAAANTINFMTMSCSEVAPTGSNTSSNVPMNCLYNYSYTQSIYTPTEMPNIDTIHGIAFNAGAGDTKTIEVYLGHTTMSTLSTSSYVPADSLTLVASNYSYNFSSGWNVINFDSAFVYDRTRGNLVIAVRNVTGSWTGTRNWATHSTNGTQSVYWYQDASSIDMTSPSASSSGTYNYVPAVRFVANCEVPTCFAPMVTLDNVDSASISVHWNVVGIENSWLVGIKANNDANYTYYGPVTDTFYTFTNLGGNTLYNVYVGSLCTDTLATVVNVRTNCGAMGLPFFEDWEDIPTNGAWPACWDSTMHHNTDPSVNWEYNHTAGGQYSMFLMASNDYNLVVSSAVPLPGDQITVDFWGRLSNASSWLKAGVITNPRDTSTFIPLIEVNQYDGQFHEYEFHTAGLDPTASYHIAWLFYSSSTSYRGAVDDITIMQTPTCIRPSSIALEYATPDSLVVSWVDTLNTGASYWVEYRLAGAPATTGWTGFMANDTVAAIPALNSNTLYDVRVSTICTGNDTSMVVSGSYRTLCGYITTLPWNEDFNNVSASSSTMIPCWDYMGGGYVATTSSYSVSGNGLGFYPSGSSTADHILVLPPFDTITSGLEMTIMIRPESTSGYSGSFSIGYVTDVTDATSFVETMLLQSTQMSTTFTQYDVVFPGAPAGSRIALRHNVSSTSWYWFIDDINVHQAPACLRPAGVTVTGVTETSATINISDPTSVGQYVVILTSGGTVVDSTVVTDTTITYSNLNGASAYSVRVYSICSDGSTTTAVTTSFSTSCATITNFPWTEGFESAAVLNCWDQEGDDEWEVGAGDYSSSTGAHSGSSNARITHSSTGNTTKLITPVLALDGTPALLTFWYVNRAWAGDIDQLNVYYRTSPVNDWVLLESITDATTTWTLDSITLPNTSSSYQIAFEMVDDYGYGVGIDDVTVSGGGSAPCDAPVIASTSVTDVTATLTWSNTGADSYEVAIVEGTWVAPASGTTVTGTSHTFTGLNAETQYTLGVRAVCSAGFNSSWETATVVTAGEPCEVPTNVTATNITFGGATIGWTNGDEETEWDIHVIGTNYDETVTVQTNPYTLTGLNAAQEYTVTVRARCDETNFSEWSAPATFSTQTCQPVNGVSVGNLTANSATVSWTAPAGVSNFEVEYGTSGFARGNGTTVTVSGTSYTITGLTADMAYDVYVRSVCAEGVTSAWSDAVEFTTLENQGIDDVANAAISLYPNPASSTVTIDGISGEATVTVVDMNGRVVITTQTLSDSVTLSLSDLAQGAYFVRITGEQVNAIRKLIVK